MKIQKFGVVIAFAGCVWAGAGQAQEAIPGSVSGVSRMQAIMEALKSGKYDQLPAETQKAMESGAASGRAAANSVQSAPSSTVEHALQNNKEWQEAARKAYVAALPPKDQALGASVMLGDGTLPGNKGRLYFFVSRSMPMSMLRAYALDALYTGGVLVVKGIRKGDTLQEYIDEAVADFNSVDGHFLSGVEVNPNLFDMFKVDVVPAVVWTNKIGLDDVGAGCENLPEGAPLKQVTFEGPNETELTLDKPECAPAAETSYYKMTGALTLPYVLDRFEEAGLSKEATAYYRTELAERNANVHQGGFIPAEGNAISTVRHDFKLDSMPKHVLLYWQKRLSEGPVQRGPFGPTFNPAEPENSEYRRELESKIERGLGLRNERSKG